MAAGRPGPARTPTPYGRSSTASAGVRRSPPRSCSVPTAVRPLELRPAAASVGSGEATRGRPLDPEGAPVPASCAAAEARIAPLDGHDQPLEPLPYPLGANRRPMGDLRAGRARNIALGATRSTRDAWQCSRLRESPPRAALGGAPERLGSGAPRRRRHARSSCRPRGLGRQRVDGASAQRVAGARERPTRLPALGSTGLARDEHRSQGCEERDEEPVERGHGRGATPSAPNLCWGTGPGPALGQRRSAQTATARGLVWARLGSGRNLP